MEQIILLFSDYTFQTVALGTALLGVISGALGSFAMLRGQSLIGDGISHAALPGVIAAFLITNNKETHILLIGALITGLLANFCVFGIVKTSRIKFDTALALVMAVFFGLGITLLTVARKTENANQAGIDSFIYGQASTLLRKDVYLIFVCGAALLLIIFALWKELKIFTFDAQYAQIIGLKASLLNALLSFLIVLAIILGLQAVGVILMSSMLIAPAVTARQWVNSLFALVSLSAILGGLACAIGTVISTLFNNLPTGPVIVICSFTFAIFSLLFAPKRGLVFKLIK